MKDSLMNGKYPYEWNGDHLFTNFVHMHQRLTDLGGYYVEILTDPFTCFDARNYGALMIVDPEDYFSEMEIIKLRRDIETEGLGLIVLADWYSKDIMKNSRFVSNEGV